MSTIGLWDDDWMRYNNIPYNLELMKISSYLKKKNNIVTLMQLFDPQYYKKVYVRKDYNDGHYIRRFFNDPKVEYGGLAFSNNIYIPLPDEIEASPPDTGIYDRQNEKTNKYIRSLYKNGIHMRLSTDGKQINPIYKKSIANLRGRTLFFHDYDISAIDDAYNEIKEIVTDHCSLSQYYINTKFPIQIYKYDDLVKWADFSLGKEFFIEYKGFFEAEELNDLMKHKNLSKRIIYNPAYNLTKEEFEGKISDLYLQILFIRKNHHFNLSYINCDNTNIPSEYIRLMFLFYCFSSFKTTEDEKSFSLCSYIKTKNFFKTKTKDPSGWFTRKELRNIFSLIQENNYEAFCLFYEKGKVEYINKKLV